jgi:hypothetical protein
MSKVNILAGANSSGKSSIIQSILLLKQTLQYGSPNRPFAFNGPLLRLGAFNDVRNTAASDKPIAFDFEFKVEEQGYSRENASWLRTVSKNSFSEGRRLSRIGLRIEISENTQTDIEQEFGSKSVPTILSAKMVLHIEDANGSTQESSLAYHSDESNFTPDFGYQTAYEFHLDNSLTEVVLADKYDGQILGGWVSHFLPNWLLVKHNVGKKRAVNVAEQLFRPRSLLSLSMADDTIPIDVAELINDWLGRILING